MVQSKKSIKVKYEYVSGTNFFYSDDNRALGLIVAHKDLKTAFDEVAIVLNILFLENYGEDIEFIPSLRFLEFKKKVNERLSKIKDGSIKKTKAAAHLNSQWKRAA
ncbi:MAG: hypothetical protein OXC62_01030 [Aestuariivita sp.]|nr:hypothetical protein [Aestuariivita sp.]